MRARGARGGRSTGLAAAAVLLLALGGCGSAAPSAPAPSVSVTVGPGPSGGAPPRDDASAGASAFTPVTVSALSQPAPAPGTDGRIHLAYELTLTNTLSQPATIAAVEVLGDGRSLLRLDGSPEHPLASWIKPLGGDPGTRVLQAGQSGLVWLDVTYGPSDPVPSTLVHRVDVQYAQPNLPLVPGALTETVATTPVSSAQAVRIGAPLAGPGWVDGDSCCVLGAHRGAVSPIDGRLWAPERYAIDYVRLDAAGRMLTGDPTRIESYPYYGTDVLAVADGPVVANVTNLPLQAPGRNPAGLTLDQYGGNHVVQDIGGGHYAFYAHLQGGNPQNLAVGQVLRRGEVLGKLGNTGNTDAPHLHFHVMDRPDPLASHGLPYVFDAFTLDGRASEQGLNDAIKGPVVLPLDRAGAGPRRGELPLLGDVMSYPPAP